MRIPSAVRSQCAGPDIRLMSYFEAGFPLRSVVCGVAVFHTMDFSCEANFPLMKVCEVSLKTAPFGTGTLVCGGVPHTLFL